MEGKNLLIAGGTSGIGFQTAKVLRGKGANVIVAARNSNSASGDLGVPNLTLDVLEFGNTFAAELPAQLHGLVYCPGRIKLKPFERLNTSDFMKDFQQRAGSCAGAAGGDAETEGASVELFSTVAAILGMP